MSGQPGIYPPLDLAAAWAHRDAPFMEASLTVAAAENAAAMHETPKASGLAEQARRRMVRTDMPNGAVGARLNYATALIGYQAGKLAAGDKAFALLMAYQQKSSQRLFEIARPERRLCQRPFSPRSRAPDGKIGQLEAKFDVVNHHAARGGAIEQEYPLAVLAEVEPEMESRSSIRVIGQQNEVLTRRQCGAGREGEL